MDYRGNDPGAVQYGNFINYYQFNSAEERIRLLPDDVWLSHTSVKNNEPYLILDVGCNSGAVTCLLHDFIAKHTKRKVCVLGIDIDPILIERAVESNSNENVTYKCFDIMNEEKTRCISDFLAKYGQTSFDTTFCLSITMWIHINNGDDGLKSFLRKCASITTLLVVEPQPWKCYQAAVKRLRKARDVFTHFVDLQWRTNVEDEIQAYLQQSLSCTKIYEAEPTKWKRKICIYHTNK